MNTIDRIIRYIFEVQKTDKEFMKETFGNEITISKHGDDEQHKITLRGDDEGHKLTLSKRADDEGHKLTPSKRADDERHKLSLSKRADDEQHITLSKRDDEGHKLILSKRADDEGHKLTPSKRTDDERHKLSLSKRSDDERLITLSKRDDEGHKLTLSKRTDDERHITLSKPDDEGHKLTLSRRADDVMHKPSLSKRADEGHKLTLSKRVDDEGHKKIPSDSADKSKFLMTLPYYTAAHYSQRLRRSTGISNSFASGFLDLTGNGYADFKSAGFDQQKVDGNGLLLLLNVLVRKFTDEKFDTYTSHELQHLEAQAQALDVIEKFGNLVKALGNAEVDDLIDLSEVHSKIFKAIQSGNEHKVPEILCTYGVDVIDQEKMENPFSQANEVYLQRRRIKNSAQLFLDSCMSETSAKSETNFGNLLW